MFPANNSSKYITCITNPIRAIHHKALSPLAPLPKVSFCWLSFAQPTIDGSPALILTIPQFLYLVHSHSNTVPPTISLHKQINILVTFPVQLHYHRQWKKTLKPKIYVPPREKVSVATRFYIHFKHSRLYVLSLTQLSGVRVWVRKEGCHAEHCLRNAPAPFVAQEE